MAWHSSRWPHCRWPRWRCGFWHAVAPQRFPALASVPRILALAAGCSVLVEAAQYVLRLDRMSSVDDVLLNTADAALAALASRRWWCATGQSVVRSTWIGYGAGTLSRPRAAQPQVVHRPMQLAARWALTAAPRRHS
jgi:hypothetical protein